MEREELNWYWSHDANPVHMMYFKDSANKFKEK